MSAARFSGFARFARRAGCAGLVAAAALLPEAAAACAVCGFGEDQSRGAYIATTALLSALPIGLLAVLLFCLRRAARSEAAQDAVPPPDSQRG